MPLYVTLPDRAFIAVTGNDRASFLQGLITQDVDRLSAENPLLYSALLTPQGKYLYDFFLWHSDDAIVIETDAPRRDEFLTLLRRYTLRKDVQLTAQDGDVFQIIEGSVIGALPDPRHDALGARTRTKPDGDDVDIAQWDTLRLAHNVPDCPKDLRVGLSSPFEGNIDLLNGISFEKGCYMGQELVSRIHHRGLVKRRFPDL